ncbi:hypothetical protein ACFC3F_03425 [Microbacterium sp. NPDC055910]|uniref:hypothetical protein n=1 Tax=Microbacterium sp. NPDC055910 TaxID=3345659 RepID=UPI0035D9DE17
MSGVVAFEDSRHDSLYTVLPGADWHVWPLVRWPLVTGAVDAELATHAPVHTGTPRIFDEIRSAAAGLAVGRGSLGRMPAHRRFLFVTGGVTVHPTPEGERNWLADAYLAAAPEESVLLTDAIRPRGRTRRTAFPATFTTSAALVGGELADRLPRGRRADVDAARRAVDDLVDAFEPFLPVPIPQEARGIAVQRLLRADRRHRTLRRVTERLDPDVVLMEDASYGSRSPSVEWMRRQGITVVEPQHGWIGGAHGAYNFGAAMWDDELRDSLPSELLLFGEFWGRDLAHPARPVIIGKPHLETAAAKIREKGQRSRRAIVVSSVYRRESMMDLTLRVRDVLPSDWTVAFRPHPSERATVEELYPRLAGAHRVEFDRIADVYESLGDARIVVGTASTVLYEALRFDVDVLVMQSPLTAMYAPADVFGPSISDDSQLSRAIASAVDGSRRTHAVNAASIWAPRASENAAAYLASAGARSDSTSATDG